MLFIFLHIFLFDKFSSTFFTDNQINNKLKINIINGDIAHKIVRNRVVFGVILTIHCLIKIVRNRVPKKVKRTESCFTVKTRVLSDSATICSRYL